MILLLVFGVIAVTAFTVERLLPARPQPILRQGLSTDVAYLISNILLRVALTNSLALLVADLGQRFLPSYAVAVLTDQPLWLQAIAVIFVLDFFFYWMHRAKHHWDWWWRLHETHHSSREMDWFSSVRFHPFEKILDRLIYVLPIAFLGVSEEALLILATTDALVASINHSNTRLRIGPLIYLIVGPEMHRWHHAADEQMQRRNFGNNLSIFDWIFGTACVPAQAPSRLGLDDDAYPTEGFVSQFFYAFRPMARPAEERVRPGRGVEADAA